MSSWPSHKRQERKVREKLSLGIYYYCCYYDYCHCYDLLLQWSFLAAKLPFVCFISHSLFGHMYITLQYPKVHYLQHDTKNALCKTIFTTHCTKTRHLTTCDNKKKQTERERKVRRIALIKKKSFYIQLLEINM